MRKLLVIAGVPVDDLTMEEVLDRIESFVDSGSFHQIATVNADFVVQAWDDPELRYILQVADILTPDGMPLVWGARLLGVPLYGRVTGADLVPALCERGAQRGWRFYFLGAGPGVAVRAAQVLTARYPGLQIVGIASPPNLPVVEMDFSVVEQIREVRPDLLLVAFGNPKQEKWIHMHGLELGVKVAIGVGGTFDLIAGKLQRAPQWMQKGGLEWCYRLFQEPRRLWRRYVRDLIRFSRFFGEQWWAQQQGRIPLGVIPQIEEAELNDPVTLKGPLVISFNGPLTVATRETLVSCVEDALLRSANLVLDASRLPFVDSAGLGTLVDLSRRARAAGGDLKLAGALPQVVRTLELTQLDRFLTLVPSLEDGLATHRDPLPLLSLTRQVGCWTVLPLPARLDLHTIPQVRSEAESALAAVPTLVLDFGSTRFLDSAGIAILLSWHRQARQQGGEVRLAALSREIRRTLELAGVESILSLYSSVEEALMQGVSR